MAITSSHLVAGVPDPTVDQSLVDAVHGAIGAERVPEDVPASNDFPLASNQQSREVVMSFVGADRCNAFSTRIAVRNRRHAKGVVATGMNREPIVEHLTKFG